jgi:hypothetical protein
MRRPLIRGEDFEASIRQGEQAQGKVMEVYQRKGKYLGLGKGKRKRRNVWEKKKGLVLLCGKVLFMSEMCARIKHGRISMTKPLEFYFK